jgi:hypothetical protein
VDEKKLAYIEQHISGDEWAPEVCALIAEVRRLREELEEAEYRYGRLKRLDLEPAFERVEALKSVLRRNGFRECDVAACNCGSWHAGPNSLVEARAAWAQLNALLAEEAPDPDEVADARGVMSAALDLSRTQQRTLAIQVTGLRKAERGRCAKLAETYFRKGEDGVRIAAAIRAMPDEDP